MKKRHYLVAVAGLFGATGAQAQAAAPAQPQATATADAEAIDQKHFACYQLATSQAPQNQQVAQGLKKIFQAAADGVTCTVVVSYDANNLKTGTLWQSSDINGFADMSSLEKTGPNSATSFSTNNFSGKSQAAQFNTGHYSFKPALRTIAQRTAFRHMCSATDGTDICAPNAPSEAATQPTERKLVPGANGPKLNRFQR